MFCVLLFAGAIVGLFEVLRAALRACFGHILLCT